MDRGWDWLTKLLSAHPKFCSIFPLLKSKFFQAAMLFFPISGYSPKSKVALLGENERQEIIP